MAKARQMYPVVYPGDCDPDSFKASTGWLKRFKDRHGILYKGNPCQQPQTQLKILGES